MDEEYDIVPATVEDRDRIAEFLRQTFYKYEPLNMSSRAPPDRSIESIFSLKFLPEGLSLLAVTRSGLIIGVAINGESRREGDIHKRKIFHRAHQSYSEIGNFVDKLEERAKIWNITNADRALCLNAISVAPIASGRGLGKTLMMQSRDIAISKGYGMFWAVCTSHYSARIARGIGMRCVAKQIYADYTNEKGVKVFVPPSPHKEAGVYVLELNS